MGSSKPVSRKNDLVVQEHDGEILIYDLREDKALCLNETSALVWRTCDGRKSISEIVCTVGEELKSERVEDVVWLALDQLRDSNLIDEYDKLDSKLAGISRREAVRRVGLATLVALPIIASIAAPVAAQAGSCTRTNSGCTGNNRARGCNCTGVPGGTCATGLTCTSIPAGPTCC